MNIFLSRNLHACKKEPEVDKTALKEAFKQGIEVPYAELVENQSIQIK